MGLNGTLKICVQKLAFAAGTSQTLGYIIKNNKSLYQISIHNYGYHSLRIQIIYIRLLAENLIVYVKNLLESLTKISLGVYGTSNPLELYNASDNELINNFVDKRASSSICFA